MKTDRAERAILFADVSGSTQLYDTLGDERAQQIVTFCLDRLSDITQGRDGQVVKTIGDEILTLFPTADSAVQAACDMQQYMQNNATAGPVQLAIRVGVHYGHVLESDDDVFGDAVNVAARVTALSKARQILTTEETVGCLSDDLCSRTREVDHTTVKGKRSSLAIFEVVWERPEDVTRLAPNAPGLHSTAESTLLRLRHRGREVSFPKGAQLVIGRDPTCDLMTGGRLTSRVHARIEYRRGKFVLVDQSTNGTFVRTQDGKEVYLRREELPLWGSGVISLGETSAAEPEEAVGFLCE
jgi:class 3 adenylate cyclase